MKIVKYLLKVTLIVIGTLTFTIIILFWVDSQKTSYLNINKNTSSAKNSYLITNANIIPMTNDTILTNKMVYIKDGIIEKIADVIRVDSVPIFDAQNKYLTPGLIDMHVHVWDTYELGLYLSNGVTAIRNLWGMPMHLRMKDEVIQENIYSPLFFTAGPKLTGSEFISSDNLNINSPCKAKEKIISYKKRGYDFIKTYAGLEKEIFDTIIQQASISKIDIVSHPSEKVPFSYHLHPQIKSIEHAEEIVQKALKFNLDTLKLQSIIETIALANHANYSPTIIVFNNIYQMMMNDSVLYSNNIKYMNPLIRKVDSKKQFERWYAAKQKNSDVINQIKKQHDFHITIVKKLQKAGINIICGTDAGIGVTLPGFSIHQELAFYKEAGLSNYEVLKTATVNASKVHTIMNSLGTIKKGRIANLLVLDKNPLLDLSTLKKPASVFIKGRKLTRETLDQFNEHAHNRKNLFVSAFRYVENLLFEK